MKLTPIWLINRSRQLRKNQTPWEAKLWYHLRAKRFDGYRFKRQLRIDNYIVDFCCRQKMLIIELDGSQHNDNVGIRSDLERDKYLNKLGYHILHFWNNDLDENIDGVLETILRTLETSPPAPLLDRRGEAERN